MLGKVFLVSVLSSVVLVGCSSIQKSYDTEFAKMQEIYKSHKWTEIPISREQLEKGIQRIKDRMKKEGNGDDEQFDINNFVANTYVSEVIKGEYPRVWMYVVMNVNTKEGKVIYETLGDMVFNCRNSNDDRMEIAYNLVDMGKLSVVIIMKGMHLTKPSYVNIDMYGKGRASDHYRVYMSQQDIDKAMSMYDKENGFDYKKYACANNY
ncbi:hypothetical protein [Gallibacterium genomosp. 1]|uniref:hypothetical protein n=1 Tax=Gallibacterium genomosp. 1 TaxID=155515 RepID=UPI00080285F6|nr:hypothetical protein [Gallibacterium genomosp. 1]OBX02214.1 hypothetical protein QV04_04065 [Gallibacterium genomosp. 1]